MNEQEPSNNAPVSTNKMIWYVMQGSTLIMLAIVLFLNLALQLEPLLPKLFNILTGIGILSIVIPFILSNRFKRHQAIIIDNIHLGIDNSDADMQSYTVYLLIGMSLCHLPGIFGLVFYILVNDLSLSLFLIGISFLLGLLYKPELRNL